MTVENIDVLAAVLRSNVRVIRDEWMVPHIQAQSSYDAFVAQGYFHAKDRIWQMDSSRMKAQGRWAEWVGKPGIEADKLARRLGGTAASIRDYEALSPDAASMVDAYTVGVNAFLESTENLPLEYQELGVRPEPWLGWHCIVQQRGNLMGSLWFKLWRAMAADAISPELLSMLRYDDSGTDRVCIPPGLDADRYVATLGELTPAIAALTELASADSTGGGSNNWAISGERTKAGLPLLAGDPHLAFGMPATFAQMHLACDDFDVIGLTSPGMPGIPNFGHNGSVAWCVTHAFADIHDLYVEQFSENDSTKYLFQGEWLQAEFTSETILVRGSSDVTVPITRTIHGPVIAGDPESGNALTLKSMQFFELDSSFETLLPQLTSKSVEELYETTRGWGLIDLNLVAADVEGAIGHRVQGIVPRRPRLNGWLPVPGWTGEYEWNGTIDFEDMPHVVNPERGFLVTANNRVTDRIERTGDYFCTDAHPPYRARRIEELITTASDMTPAGMNEIFYDTSSEPAKLFQSALRNLELTAHEPAARIRDLICAWDANLTPDSTAATYYSRFRWSLAATVTSLSGLGATQEHSLNSFPVKIHAENHVWWMLPNLLRSGDTSFLGGKEWDEVLSNVLIEMAPGLEDEAWGVVHEVRVNHPLTGILPSIDEKLNPRGASVGGDNETVVANGSLVQAGLRAAYGAVARYVFAVGDWDESLWIVMSGVSGDPESPEYMNQHQRWAAGDLVPMRYSWPLIEAEARFSCVYTADQR